MNFVPVLDTHKAPQNPVHPAAARRMMRQGQAAAYRRHPFTIILKAPAPAWGTQMDMFAPPPPPAALHPEPLRLKIDPGSRATGLALVNDQLSEIRWAGELKHRGPEIKKALDARRSLRRGRRNRQTRYRPARFANRTRSGERGCHSCGGNAAKAKSLCRPCAAKPAGELTRQYASKWLPPSVKSRVFNIQTWVRRLTAVFPISAISVEVARFDTQLMQNPEIGGVEYQRGTLAGYEVREYLLEKFNRRCAYCAISGVGKSGVPLEVEHIQPRSRGGTNRISNLTLACVPCNQAKGNQTAAEFGHPEVQKRALAPLKDAAMMNATRYAIRDMLAGLGLPLETGTGGRTKFNRTRAGLDKAHWADAACVGESTPDQWQIPAGGAVQEIRSRSYARRGRRQVCLTDKHGFPAQAYGKKPQPKSGVQFHGYRTGDIVKVVKTRGKWAGVYRGRVSVQADGQFKFKPRGGKGPASVSHRDIVKLIDRCGSFNYSQRPMTAPAPR